MPQSQRPLFLARRSYRRRRMMDAARLLPVFGALALMLPILWRAPGAAGGRSTATGTVYVFVVWALLIGLAFVLARRLRPAIGDEADPPEPAGPTLRGD
ncbi:hypothetical protein [Frigidibacter oleivorans]|uniref:hypothetical protein n=1 Tax=Frigidibacter oleivorans TaxID=2487129 RepID=UPI000F8E9D46|nr:hypothetical protein [Frigidibacter oleivorans]